MNLSAWFFCVVIACALILLAMVVQQLKDSE